MISLGKRLFCAASMIRGGGQLIDVGTDHAYLPVYLVQSGAVPSAIACDIGAGPLKNAQKTVSAYGLQKEISLRLSDGLQNILPEEADEICICGMGGNLMEEILSAAPWVRREQMHLVLQPMTHLEDIRRYLCKNGFTIEREICVEDNGRVYLTIGAIWNNAPDVKAPGYYYFGELMGQPGLAQRLVFKQYSRVKIRAESLHAVGRNPEEYRLLTDVLSYYQDEKYNEG